jgi:hypothetical protein
MNRVATITRNYDMDFMPFEPPPSERPNRATPRLNPSGIVPVGPDVDFDRAVGAL